MTNLQSTVQQDLDPDPASLWRKGEPSGCTAAYDALIKGKK
jgi:hypothetical protein